MKKTRTQIGILAAGILAATLALGAAWAEESPSVLLEKGIYQEETAGNLGEAIQIYGKIASDAQANRAFAAQALLRMGQCQLKQGRGDLADEAFDRLIREFPEQTEWVAQAQKARAGSGALLPAPWKDGEEMTLDLISAAGVSVGTMTWDVHSSTYEGKPVWAVTSAISVPMAGHKQTTRVMADPDTFAPLYGETINKSGEFRAIYRPTDVQLTMNVQGKEISKTVERQGIAFDNEQALYVIRRLPLAPNYHGSFPIFAVQGGAVVECRIEVTGTENVETPLGTFLCHKVRLGVFSQGAKALEHQLWYTTDENRYLAKYDAGTAVMTLKSVEVKTEGVQPFRYVDPEYGYELALPAGWTIASVPTPQLKQVWALESPAGIEDESFFILSAKDAAWDSLRTMADDRNAKRAQFMAGYEVDSASWTNVPISGETGLAWTSRYTDQGTPKVEYNVAAFRGSLAYMFTFRSAPESMNSLKPTWDSIVDNFKFQAAAGAPAATTK